MASIQKLGLKLEPRKLPMELLVVDHIEKAPPQIDGRIRERVPVTNAMKLFSINFA